MRKKADDAQYQAYLEARSIVMGLNLPPFRDPAAPLPLKIGIFEDLAAVIGEDQARSFLRLWTSRHEYRMRLAQGGSRYDLNGEPAGEIAPPAPGQPALTAPKKKRSREVSNVRTVAQAQRLIRRTRRKLDALKPKQRANMEKKIRTWEGRIEAGMLEPSGSLPKGQT